MSIRNSRLKVASRPFNVLFVRDTILWILSTHAVVLNSFRCNISLLRLVLELYSTISGRFRRKI